MMNMKKRMISLLTCVLTLACVFIFSGKTMTVYATDESNSVVKDVLKVKCQVMEGTSAESESTTLRLISSVDTVAYKKVGFEILYKGRKVVYSTDTVQSRILARTDLKSYGYNPKVIDAESGYFITVNLVDIANKNFGEIFTVKPYVITLQGETVYGVTRLVKISDSYNNYGNIAIKADSEEAAEALTVTSGTKSYDVKEVRYDAGSGYANLLIDDSDDFPSLTKMTINNGEEEYDTVMYRNLTTTGTAGDQTWYTAYDNDEEDKYVIVTDADIYGFKHLSEEKDFTGKTIFLGADIELNDGDATNWASKAPTNEWSPIGQTTPFAGKFDGYNSAISGLYLSSESENLGLFCTTAQSATIQNLKIINSFLESTNSDSSKIGSIVGKAKGTLKGLYSEAIVKAAGSYAGGILGSMDTKGSVSNCWFNGYVTTDGQKAGGIFGAIEECGNITVKNCLNMGDVTSTYSGDWAGVGGIGGYADNNDDTTFTITDCLNVGAVKAQCTQGVGSVMGRVASDTAITKVYTTNDVACSAGGTISTENTVEGFGDECTTQNSVAGECVKLTTAELVGVAASNNTELDFNNTWVMKGCQTPELKQFSSNDVLVKGNIDWYESNKATKTYTIKTRSELYGFAELAQTEDFKDWKIYLGNDITINETDREEWSRVVPKYAWHPIGRETVFKGTFDGQGHTISGIYLKTYSNQIGLFGETDNATIKDFRLKNSYFESTTHTEPHIGSVIGEGDGLVSEVYSDAIVISTGMSAGGLIGYSEEELTIDQCWFDGSVTSTQRYVGGILGSILGRKESSNLTVQHCLNTGDITSTYSNDWAAVGGLVGRTWDSEFVFEDSLNMGTISVQSGEGVGSLVGRTGRSDNTNETVTVTVKDVYTIDNITYEGGTIGKENTPIEGGFGNHSMNQFFVAGTNKGFYQTQTKTRIVTEEYVTGLCANNKTALDFSKFWRIGNYTTPMLTCFLDDKTIVYRDTDISWYTENESAMTYEIKTMDELYGLAELSHLYDFDGWTIKLGNDINITNTGEATTWATSAPEYYWEAIGKYNTFKGSFDGQGYAIKGLYIKADADALGLFGKTSGTIKNVKVENSYLRSEGNTEPRIGSIVGVATGTINGVYSNAIMDVYGDYAGGIVGCTESVEDGETAVPLTISESWYDGTLTSSKRYFGGIMGATANGIVTIENCLNTGTIISTATTDKFPHLGGVVGVAEHYATLNVIDCVSVGTIQVKGFSATNGNAIGGVVGQYADSASGTVSSNYCIDSAVTCGISTTTIQATLDKLTNDSVTESLTTMFDSKTTAQLTGVQARYNTALDFVTTENTDGEWVAIDGELLQLKRFASGKTWNQGDEAIVADTSWYSESWKDSDDKKNYTISTIAEMVGLSEVSKGYSFDGEIINLEEDIIFNLGNAADWATTAPTNEFGMISSTDKQFCGTFNGNGHTISGMYIDETTMTVGLFEEAHVNCTVQDLRLVNSFVRGTYDENTQYAQIGSIAGQADGTFENIYSDATVVVTGGKFAGGLFGRTTATSNLTRCWFDGSITSDTQYVAGILSVVDRGTTTITDCLNTGSVKTTYADGYPMMGGICGATGTNLVSDVTDDTTQTETAVLNITRCLNSGVVTYEPTTANNETIGYGSLLGHVTSGTLNITDCYVTDESCSVSGEAQSIGYTDANATVSDRATTVARDNILGDSAKAICTGLDFNTVWEVRTGDVPGLLF